MVALGELSEAARKIMLELMRFCPHGKNCQGHSFQETEGLIRRWSFTVFTADWLESNGCQSPV